MLTLHFWALLKCQDSSDNLSERKHTMQQLSEFMKMAAKNIVANRTRSLLTMLGIIIGISSVIAVLMVGGGGQQAINSEFESMSKGEAYVYFNYDVEITENDLINDADIEAIRASIPGIRAITPAVSAYGTIRGTQNEEASATIQTGNEDYSHFSTDALISGRLWTADDYYAQRRVLVIDEQGARSIFGSTNVVGMTVELTVGGRTATFTVIGVTQSSAMSVMRGGRNAQVSTPLSTLQNLSEEVNTSYFQLAILGVEKEQSLSLARQAISLLQIRHNNADRAVYAAEDLAMYTDQINTVTGMFTGIIAAIAAISLLVGGIGVMNIMLVSVTERTREIGIRKALGARTGAILFQFLIEAGMLTFFGGIIGITFGLLGGMGLCSLMGITGYISPLYVVGIVLFSVVIGLFFGINPARKAAHLNPIEALRSE